MKGRKGSNILRDKIYLTISKVNTIEEKTSQHAKVELTKENKRGEAQRFL